ncbi:glycosyltransferase [Bacillus clarus]|uniref:Glycosyl transferase 2 family protein n=1 Tax=Bacillus clarus TaxID=2338372 RepID=A0A090Z1V3_9BACI|nr:glycosyltransferase [Bacillus clarus]KFN04125.1 glycosyl transferase 2 family protein [Bacillus clarus]RFT63454.1 glycosyltransferase [Bacillus clarus]
MVSAHPSVLTTYLFVSQKKSWEGLQNMIDLLEEFGITVKTCEPDCALLNIYPKQPRIYVSVGSQWEEFQTLKGLPFHERKRWLHFESLNQIQPFKLFYAWLEYTDPLPENKTLHLTSCSSDTPLVSVFTASYRSKEKIQRPYHSLLNQTYSNWEWVIVDDSGDGDESYNQYLSKLNDSRIRRYRQDANTGYIGAVKRYAAGLCTGEILVELDHDDELTPDCLEKIVRAFQENPECGFVYGDSAEVYVENNHSHWYGWDCGFGYSMYYRVWVHEMNRWQNAYKQTVINGKTITHLVGLPNHPRAWTRDCYHQIGGHREELLVADDYDILVRTFLCTKYVAIPDLLYIQYRNEGGDNSTFLRNKQIQILCKELESYYHERIYKRVKELGLPDSLPYSRIWETDIEHPARRSAHIIHEDKSKRSMLFPIPYGSPETEHTELFKTIQEGIENNFNDIEIVIVGRIPEEIEKFASQAPKGAIRWWPMEPEDSLETCIKYAEFCTSCEKKQIVLP